MDKVRHFFMLVRIALTIFVMIIVWQNSHWSVALALTFISFSIEGLAAALKIHGEVIKKSRDANRALMNSMMDNVHNTAHPIFQTKDEDNEEA